MKLKLSILDYQFLLNYIDKLPPNIYSDIKEKYIYLIGNKESFELILDILSDKLTKDGIDQFGEINIIGLNIERIIDFISNELWE